MEHHGTDRLKHAFTGPEKRSNQIDILMPISIRKYFAELRLCARQRLGQQVHHLWRRWSRRPDLHERLSLRIDQQKGIDMHRVHGRGQTLAHIVC